MATVIKSVSTQAYTAPAGNDLTITKPAGLTVDDLMVACVAHHADVANINDDWTTPSGWTEVNNISQGGNDSDSITTGIYYKLADASDVAGGDFTFSVTVAQDRVGGCIIRVSGIRTDGSQLGGRDWELKSNTSNPSYTVSLSPAQDTVLYVAVFASISEIYNTTDVTVNGTNPTWAQQFETTTTVGTASRFEVFASIDNTPESDITTLTPTETGSGASTDSTGFLSFYLGQNDASTTPTFTTTANTAFAPAGQAGAQTTPALTETANAAFIPSGFANSPARWTNAPKPATTWTNTDKD